jgi:hypothetical protein
MVMRQQVEVQARHAVTERAADLSAKLRGLESRVGELESEYHGLRQQLKEAEE